jgi:hypothetical protein
MSDEMSMDRTPNIGTRRPIKFTSRRGLLAAATAGLLAARQLADGWTTSEAKKKRNRKRRRKNKRNKNDRTETRVDAICPGPTDSLGAGLDDESFLAQTFTALNSGRLVRADVLIFADATGSADLTLQVRDINASGAPTDEVLADATVNTSDVPFGDSTVDFTFTNPPLVAANREYALVLSKRGSRIFSWKGHADDTCDGQPFRSRPNTEPFESIGNATGLDFIFTTSVRS